MRFSHAVAVMMGLHVLPPASAVNRADPNGNLREESKDARFQVCANLATDRVKRFLGDSSAPTIRKQTSGSKQAVEIKPFGYQKLRSTKARASDKLPESFIQRHKCEEEPMITSALQKIKTINSTALEEDFLNESVGLKIRIQNQKVFFKMLYSEDMTRKLRKRTKFYVEFIEEVLKEVELPDMELVVSLLDGSPGHPGVLKAEGWPGDDLLFLSRSALSTWYLNNTIQTLPGPQACISRHRQRHGAVFRGSTTGGTLKRDDNNWIQWNETRPLPLYDYGGEVLPRYRVIETSLKRPDLLDAGFTQVVQSSNIDGHLKALSESGFMKDPMDSAHQKCFEAVVVVDGNTIPDRLPEQLAWGIPVVFVHDKKLPSDFFYDEMIPWEHFVPASPDNIEEVLEALLENKEMMKCIGRNGQNFVQHRLSLDRMKCYMTQLLMSFHDLKQSSMDAEKAVVRWEGRYNKPTTPWEQKPKNWR